MVACLIVLSLSACQSKQNELTEEVSISGHAFTLVKMPGNNRITIRLAWPNTWVFSEQSNQAVPHIGTRLMLAGGAQGFPAGEVVEHFSDMNTEGSLWITLDNVLGVLHYSPEHKDESLKMANAHLRAPSMDERWFERIRDEFAVQMRADDAFADSQGFSALRWAVFGDQPVRASMSPGENRLIESVTRAEVVAWAKSVFTRNGLTITIAGDLSAAEAGASVDALLDGIPEGEPKSIETVSADFSAKRILLHVPESTTSTLSFIGKLPPLSENAEIEEYLLADAMSGDLKSGLLGTVRDELRASYRYGAEVSGFTSDHRFLILSGQIETSKIAAAEKQLRDAYSEFRANPVIENLEELKEPYSKDFKEFLKDTGSTSNAALAAKLLDMDPNIALKLQDALDGVTESSLSRRMKTVFPSADDLIVVVNTPDKAALPDACVITLPKQALDC